MPFTSGKVASWTHSATPQPFDRADMSFDSEIVDTTNFTSSGYQSNIDGVYSCSANAEGPYNHSLGLTQGQLLTHTFAVGGGGPSFAVPLRIQNIKLNTQVRNAATRCAITLQSSGTFTVTF